MKRSLIVLSLFAVMSMFSSCSITLSGASIPAGMKTIDIGYFENNALFVVNNLSQQVTEALKERVRSQTSLSIVRNPEADGAFTGSITTYSIAPVSVQATGNSNQAPIANASRLTITVRVKFSVNFKNATPAEKKLGFEQDFTRTADFTGDIASKEQGLIATINKQLTEDIFNKAFANWN